MYYLFLLPDDNISAINPVSTVNTNKRQVADIMFDTAVKRSYVAGRIVSIRAVSDSSRQHMNPNSSMRCPAVAADSAALVVFFML